MGITAVSKAQIFIGAATYPTAQQAPLALAGFTADTYTAIGNVTSIGDFGDTAEEIKVNTISDERVYKLKGQRDAGDFSLECAFNDADPGQVALMAAMQNDANYNFKIVMNNALTPTGAGHTAYFQGMVMTAQTKLGAANAAVMLTAKVAINSAPLALAAS